MLIETETESRIIFHTCILVDWGGGGEGGRVLGLDGHRLLSLSGVVPARLLVLRFRCGVHLSPPTHHVIPMTTPTGLG